MMLLTVLTLGGAMLGATTIAGLLMIYQIRQATDLGNSAKAIFAADAGIEWGLYNYYCLTELDQSLLKDPCPMPRLSGLGNGAKVQVTCQDDTSPPNRFDCDDAGQIGSTVLIKSAGESNKASRAFDVPLF